MKTTIFLLLFLLSVGIKAQTSNNENDDDNRICETAEKVIAIRENPNLDRLEKLFKEADVVFDYVANLDNLKSEMIKLNQNLKIPKNKTHVKRKPKEDN